MVSKGHPSVSRAMALYTNSFIDSGQCLYFEFVTGRFYAKKARRPDRLANILNMIAEEAVKREFESKSNGCCTRIAINR